MNSEVKTLFEADFRRLESITVLVTTPLLQTYSFAIFKPTKTKSLLHLNNTSAPSGFVYRPLAEVPASEDSQSGRTHIMDGSDLNQAYLQ